MATCPYCRLGRFDIGDRFCGLCRKPLCQLIFDSGLYIELPEDNKGTITHEVTASNIGLSPLSMRIKDSSDTAIRIVGERTFSLAPFSAGKQLKFEIDSQKLQKRKQKVCSIDFESSDPQMEKGTLLFGLLTPAEVMVETQIVKIEEVVTGHSGSACVQDSRFEVQISNNGGQRVRVTLPPGREDNRIRIAFESGNDFELPAYSKSVPIPFIASTTVQREIVEDTLILIFAPEEGKESDNALNPIQISLYRSPCIEIKAPVFSAIIPGQVSNSSSGQTRVGEAEVFNKGNSLCTITGVSSESSLVRVVQPDQFPVVVKPGSSIIVEFVMSTRANSERISENIEFPVNLWFSTDSPQIGDVFARGSAQFNLPKIERGLMAIDFGTINSCVAYFDHAQREPTLVKDDETSESFVPSMMIFLQKLFRYEDWLLHGRDVLGNRPNLNSLGIIHSVKRAIEETDWQVYDSTYSGEQLATWIIEQLLLEASRRHNCRPAQVAMTMPAAFWGPKRKALLSACKEACRLAWGTEAIVPTTIDEPTAVAMYFYLHYDNLVLPRIKEGSGFRVLVFDFGGGTLDISIVEFTQDDSGILNVRPSITRGDNHMGGIDLDLSLLRALTKKVTKKNSVIPEAALSSSRWEFRRKFERSKGFSILQGMRFSWYQQVKELKEKLSEELAVEFSFDSFYDKEGNPVVKSDGTRFEFKCRITQEMFEKMIRARVNRAKHLVRSTLSSISIKPTEVDAVLLTGQSSKIPCFRREVWDIFGHLSPEAKSINIPLKESVAAGAAWGVMQKALGRIHINRLDRTSYRYGIEGTWTSEPSPLFKELIPINSIFDGDDMNSVKLRIKKESEQGFREMFIIQNGTKNDKIKLDGTNPDITIIGRVSLTEFPPGEVMFTLFFSRDTGLLTAKVDGNEVAILPSHDETSEAVYL